MIHNIKHIIYIEYCLLVHPIGIKKALHRLSYCPAYSPVAALLEIERERYMLKEVSDQPFQAIVQSPMSLRFVPDTFRLDQEFILQAVPLPILPRRATTGE